MDMINKATTDDLPFLQELEQLSFDPSRQFNLRSFRRSVLSPNQTVYILTHDGQKCASAIIHLHERTWRLYSIAVLPSFRHLQLGRTLLNHIIQLAKENNIQRITLEADANQSKLIAWYESFGFKFTRVIPNYYGENEPANKMDLVLFEPNRRLSNVVVIDYELDWLKKIPGIEVASAEQFINENRYQTGEFRVFNLCSSYAYQTTGYYVSLFASARELRAIPNVATIEDFTESTIVESIGDEVGDLIRRSLKHVRTNHFTLQVLFGKTKDKELANLARALYKLFESPFLEFTFEKNRKWRLIKVHPIAANEIEADDAFIETAIQYFQQKRFTNAHFKNYKYDLAILVDPKEPAPPSNKAALTKFKHAAEKVGFYTEFITKEDYGRVTQFDALFIRATTNVNDYTYQFSRLAYAEGLVVIDDPWAILKCANKLYLHESMNSHGILTPKTLFVTHKTPLKDIMAKFTFPLVLKRPDSSSSLGVYKVQNEQELKERLDFLFISSEIIIAQEYVKSSFDWRVGVLSNKAIYVCKYYMAKNHWQIYNWDSTRQHAEVGAVDTMLVEDAPKAVVQAALDAVEPMGDGFYGVDIKEANGKIYVIEVNDNPSIDHHWEDRILGDKLYLMIMRHFYERIEAERNFKKRSTHPVIES